MTERGIKNTCEFENKAVALNRIEQKIKATSMGTYTA